VPPPTFNALFLCTGNSARSIVGGHPITGHWGVEDPAAFIGPARRQRWLFGLVYDELERRIDIFTQLPFESLDRLSLEARIKEIGAAQDAG